ncbi:MAG: hypothetical protein WA705_10305 [Candidatus Ozemobacteraceae bacterium]
MKKFSGFSLLLVISGILCAGTSFAEKEILAATAPTAMTTTVNSTLPTTVTATTTVIAASVLPEKPFDVQYKLCPIMGGEVKADVVLLHEGKIFHFCCPACIAAFKNDPAGSIAKIKDAKEVPLTVTNKDGKCPITGEPADSSVFSIKGDKITFYCCKECIAKDVPAAK